MNREQLQKLTKQRVKEAKILYENRCFDGAYYLLGYAVECGLKSCISLDHTPPKIVMSAIVSAQTNLKLL
jgi:hypothetical protein